VYIRLTLMNRRPKANANICKTRGAQTRGGTRGDEKIPIRSWTWRGDRKKMRGKKGECEQKGGPKTRVKYIKAQE